MKQTRWGIIGLGNVAHSFARDFQYVKEGTIIAAASRSIQKARDFCEEFDIPRPYGNYEAMIHDHEVDVIYIATPHNLHYQNALAGIRAGKAVVCEKPITVNSNELDAILAVQISNRAYLMEGMWTYFLPPILKVQEWIQNGEIGTIKYLRADFAFRSNFDPNNRLFNPDLAGGALLDIGIYPIALAQLMIGEEPEKIHVSSRKAGTGVDLEETMIFEYKNGIKANLHASLDHNAPNEALIAGTKGYIIIPEFFKCKKCFLFAENDLKDQFINKRKAIGYNFEIEAVQRDLKLGKTESDIMPLSTSLQIQKIMDDVRSKF